MSFDIELKKDLGKTITSSKVIKNENLPMRVKKPKYLLMSDSFRAIVQRLSPDSPDFTPDTFQVLKWWMVNSIKPTKDIVEVLVQLKTTTTIEFRIGTYSLSRIGEKKRNDRGI